MRAVLARSVFDQPSSAAKAKSAIAAAETLEARQANALGARVQGSRRGVFRHFAGCELEWGLTLE